MPLVCVWLHVCLLVFSLTARGRLLLRLLFSSSQPSSCVGLQQVGHNCLLLRTPVARVSVCFRQTQSRCGQNQYRYHIWCMRVVVEPTFFWAFPEVWTCNGLFAYSPGLGCLCRPLTGPLFPIGIEHLIYMKFFCHGSSNGY